MSNKAKIALAAALIFGSASASLAGEGSSDLSNAPNFDITHSAPTYSAPAYRGSVQRSERRELSSQSVRHDRRDQEIRDRRGRVPADEAE
jgi:hypothetical protein